MVTEIGPLTKLPSWVMNLSPFTHLSHLPGGPFEVVSAVVLTLIALALMAGRRSSPTATATSSDPSPIARFERPDDPGGSLVGSCTSEAGVR